MRAATAAGWRSRAAFKLIEIDRRHHLLGQAAAVLDLGAAPGGWCQVARQGVAETCPVIGVDLLECQPLAGVEFQQADFTAPATVTALGDRLRGQGAVLLSDAAPDLSGVRLRDDAAGERLVEGVFAVAQACAARAVVAKSFEGTPLARARELALEAYAKVKVQHVAATRAGSREAYVIARQPRPGADQDRIRRSGT